MSVSDSGKQPSDSGSSSGGKQNCPACSGRKVISWATEDVKCSACNGTGKVPSNDK